jgi:Domain of unknown function (DUF4340)
MKICCGDSMWRWWLVTAMSLGGAYWASRPVGGSAEMQIAIVNLDLSHVAKVELTSPETVIEASRRVDLADRWWIDVTRTRAAPSLAASSVPAAPEHFLASKKFKDSLAVLSPFRAIRIIPNVANEQLVEFGLKDSKKILMVKDSGGATLLSLAIGKQMYGTRNTYVLNQADKMVLLITGELISDFEKAEVSYYERNIMDLDPEEIQSATLSIGAKSLSLSHVKRDAKGVVVWTGVEGDGAPAISATSWFERFDQLKVIGYATSDEQARLSADPAVAEVKLVAGGSRTEVIQFRKTSNNQQDTYWLTSSYLGWNVKIAPTRGEPLLKDLPQVVSP